MRLSRIGIVFLRLFGYTRNISKNNPTNKEKQMTVSTATYKVGDLFTTQKSKVTGTILEIAPTNKNTVRVKLDVNGNTRWTTWKA
jgi:hypothetical protein